MFHKRILPGTLALAIVTAAHLAPAAQVEAVRVPSVAMKRDIPATVVLPDASAAQPDRRFPVLYLLHGAGDNERGWLDRTPVREMADRHGIIIVTPAVGNSWYFDSPEDNNWQFETFVAAELVGFMDARYRTIAKRQARALAGNSMGGHGAMFLAVRHKDTFSAAAPMSGGMDIRASDPQVGAFPNNWDLKQRLGSIQAHPERWNELTVINQVDRLKDGELAISIDCGTEDFFLTVNRQLHAKLTTRGILHNYAEHPGTHNWDYWKLALPRQMAFLSRHLEGAAGGQPAPGDAEFPQPSPSARHTEKVAAVRSGDYDLVLIGDSITHTLQNFGGKYDALNAVWNKHYAPRRAINLGHNGYRTEQKRNFHVFLLLGQSNMAGYAPLDPGDEKPVARVLAIPTISKGGFAWKPAAHPLHNRLPATDRFGLGLPFAIQYIQSRPNVTVGLIPVAWGGERIDHLNKNSPTYQDAITKARWAAKQGFLKGVLWHQGESDTVTKELAGSYARKLDQLVADLRSDLGEPSLPFIAGNLAEFYGTGPDHNAPARVEQINQVRQALRDLPRRVPQTAFVEAIGLKSEDGHMVHFNRASYIELGKRYAQAIEPLAKAAGDQPAVDPPPTSAIPVPRSDGSQVPPP